MPAIDITDDPWTVRSAARELSTSLPALINIYTCRMNWHVGIGIDGPPEWDRFNLVTQRLIELGLSAQLNRIKKEERAAMEQLWAI